MTKTIVSLLAVAALAFGQQFMPKESHADKPDPIASADAVHGGRIVEYLENMK